MSKREEEFLIDYLTWMKGPGRDQEALHVCNFGYERTLPIVFISLTPTRLNFQTSELQIKARWSIAVVGEKHLGRYEEIITVDDRIREDTQALLLDN